MPAFALLASSHVLLAGFGGARSAKGNRRRAAPTALDALRVVQVVIYILTSALAVFTFCQNINQEMPQPVAIAEESTRDIEVQPGDHVASAGVSSETLAQPTLPQPAFSDDRGKSNREIKKLRDAFQKLQDEYSSLKAAMEGMKNADNVQKELIATAVADVTKHTTAFASVREEMLAHKCKLSGKNQTIETLKERKWYVVCALRFSQCVLSFKRNANLLMLLLSLYKSHYKLMVTEAEATKQELSDGLRKADQKCEQKRDDLLKLKAKYGVLNKQIEAIKKAEVAAQKELDATNDEINTLNTGIYDIWAQVVVAESRLAATTTALHSAKLQKTYVV